MAVSSADHVIAGEERARSFQSTLSCFLFPSHPSPPISHITMAESSLRSRAKNRRQSAQVDVSPDNDEDGHPQQDPVRGIQLPLAQKTCCTHPQSLGCPYPTRIAPGVSGSEHDSRRCSHRPRLCTTLLQNQPPRPSSVRAAHIRSPSTSRLTIFYPSFDEVHFGKFAAYYILREYYFDVHPPFAKLLFGLAGWFVGFDGQFNFENIGDDYTENHVPYVGMRALPAILGSLTIPIVYGIMKESGYGTVIAAFSASIVLFGMYGYISATTKLSVYFYIFFSRQRAHCAVTPHFIGRYPHIFPLSYHVFLCSLP